MAVRRGEEYDEKNGIYVIGLPGAWTRSAEYPLFGLHISNLSLPKNDAKITGWSSFP